MTQLNLKPTHAPIKAYYETLAKFGRANFDNEGNIRGAFEDLLKKCARQFDWTLVPEYPITRNNKSPLRVDGGLIDAFNLPRAWWEAKDTKDDLRVEMEKKFALGYPRTNILFPAFCSCPSSEHSAASSETKPKCNVNRPLRTN